MNKKITHHIQFSPEDEKRVRTNAEKVGMTVTAFIKSRALNTRPRRKPLQLYYILDHTETLDKLIQEIRTVTGDPHRSRWLYQADLERIDRKLTELLQTERELVDRLWRR